MRQIKRLPSQILARLDQKPHKSQLKNKMVKGKMDNRGWANDVSVIYKGRENTHYAKTWQI